MGRVGAAQLLSARFAQTDLPHQPALDELGHRPDGLLDRDGGIHAVQVVEVDVVGAEVPQGALGAGSDCRRVLKPHIGPRLLTNWTPDWSSICRMAAGGSASQNTALT